MNPLNPVQENYTVEGMPARLEQALLQAGFASGPINWSELAQLDQFHVRGLLASKELAEKLDLRVGEHVLDVGSGLGGPARFLAAVHGCQVTGIDLTQPFVEVANQLSQRTGLSQQAHFVQGDALELPFAPESFDHAWTQHVAMSIEDKVGLYKGIHRVLKPGGQLAIYDPVRGENGPVIYPVPWAQEASISFLASSSEMAQALSAAGFSEVSTTDVTDQAVAWCGEMQRLGQTPAPINPLSLGKVMGPEVGQRTLNFARNVQEGRVRLMQVVVQKTSG